jgi:hypothetical protein
LPRLFQNTWDCILCKTAKRGGVKRKERTWRNWYIFYRNLWSACILSYFAMFVILDGWVNLNPIIDFQVNFIPNYGELFKGNWCAFVQFNAPSCSPVQFNAPSCNPVQPRSPKEEGGYYCYAVFLRVHWRGIHKRGNRATPCNPVQFDAPWCNPVQSRAT